jgi:sugar phosphate isomerase/epimerase
MTKPLPVVGAAMPSTKLAEYRDWLLDSQRDLEIQDAAELSFLDSDWHPVVKNIRAQLDGHTGRVGIHGPFWGLPIAAIDPKVRVAVKERLKQSLDFCAELGASHMVVHSPLDFLGTPYMPFSRYGNFNLLEMIHLTLDEAVAYATSIKCALVIETIYDRDPSLWMEMVKSFDSPYVRASVDVGHVFINHHLGAPPPDYWVRHADIWLGHVHLQDSDGYADRHWIPGDGDINFKSIFDALGTLEQNPRLIIEVIDKGGSIIKAAQWFEEQGLAC